MIADRALGHQARCAWHNGFLPAYRRFSPSALAVVSAPEIGDLQSADALRAWLGRLCRDCELVDARYVHLGHQIHLRGQTERPPLRFLSSRGEESDPWRAGDPVVPHIADTFEPFPWSAADDSDLPDYRRAWLGVERLRGIAAGIAIPIQDYGAGPAYISLYSRTAEEAAALLREEAGTLFVRAVGFHCRAKAIVPKASGPAGPLTDRELGCLRHAAAGANVPQTASSLGIAPRTVELHFARATRKLGATNKLHAVAIALSAGLIRI